MFTKKKVEKVQTKGKIKVMKKIREEQQRRAENADLLNQSFDSEGLCERKEAEHIKLKDSSSSDDQGSSSEDSEYDQQKMRFMDDEWQTEEVREEQDTVKSNDTRASPNFDKESNL